MTTASRGHIDDEPMQHLVDSCSTQSSYDDDQDDSDVDDDNDNNDEEDDLSLKAILFGAWRQHLLAIGVAFLATAAHHYYRNPMGGAAVVSEMRSVSSRSRSPSNNMAAPTMYSDVVRHQHLEGYHRMANISFCLDDHALVPPSPSKHLKSLEFFIPNELYEALDVLFQADEEEDDFYQFIDQYSPDNLKDNAQYECLLAQHPGDKSDPRDVYKKIRGRSFYYASPSLEDIYPVGSVNDDEFSLPGRRVGPVNERRRKLEQPHLTFTGFAAKFVNLSPAPVLLHWDGHGGHDDSAKLVGEIAPFEAIGTATKPGHSFFVSPVYDSKHALERWTLTSDSALVFYEPQFDHHRYFNYNSGENKAAEARRLKLQYQLQLLNKAYARDYLISSKRNWLGNFPRQPPVYSMHDADFIGQHHTVTDGQSGRSFDLEVLSVAPRVLQIENFLSAEECEQIIQSAKREGLNPSTLFGGGGGGTIAPHQTRDSATRSSDNAWLPRELSTTTETVYQRAATVLKLDPDLLAKYHVENPQSHSIAESLQVVHYNAGGEEYQPHHDFVVPPITNRYQPTRFATLLLYLNTIEGKGGETVFPRATTKDKAEGISVQPKQGRAVLFYNMLPDGNVDDLSQHGSNPTNSQEEKWLANLWIWDPVIA